MRDGRGHGRGACAGGRRSVAATASATSTAGAGRSGGRGGFTIVELLASLLIVGTLVALLIVGVRQAGVIARDQAERAVARNMGTAVEQFEQTFGFAVPLLHDGPSMSVAEPVLAVGGQLAAGETPFFNDPSNPQLRLPAVFDQRTNGDFLRGLGGGGDTVDAQDRYEFGTGSWRLANQRYSKLSLSYYLVGVGGAEIDGVLGAGMADVVRTGAIAVGATRRTHEPFFDATSESARVAQGYLDPLEFEENEAGAPTLGDRPGEQIALADRRGRAWRYYRWEHGDEDGEVASTFDLNIPSVLLDPEVLEATDFTSAAELAETDLASGDAELKAARWAVVGAGADGLFGTEPIGVLREELGLQGRDAALVRQEAAADNPVAVGR